MKVPTLINLLKEMSPNATVLLSSRTPSANECVAVAEVTSSIINVYEENLDRKTPTIMITRRHVVDVVLSDGYMEGDQ